MAVLSYQAWGRDRQWDSWERTRKTQKLHTLSEHKSLERLSWHLGQVRGRPVKLGALGVQGGYLSQE